MAEEKVVFPSPANPDCVQCVHRTECPPDERSAVIYCEDFAPDDSAGETDQRVTPPSADSPGQSDADADDDTQCSRCRYSDTIFCIVCAHDPGNRRNSGLTGDLSDLSDVPTPWDTCAV